MYCPHLKDLPSPPPGRTGWPWAEETISLPDTLAIERPDKLNKPKRPDKTWPKISIVTPSYNQGQFLEETIRSILLQGYPNLEYIIIDGGSTDRSVEIIKKYEKWLSFWVSESDKGQSDAINKGWSKSTGKIYAWLNSDDLYLPYTLHIVGEYFYKNPDYLMVYGNCNFVNKFGEKIGIKQNIHFNPYKLLYTNYIPQSSLFFKERIFEKVEYLDINLHYIMDWDLCLRTSIILNKMGIGYIPKTLSCLRMYHECKTVSSPHNIISELQIVYKKLEASSIPHNRACGDKKRFKYYLFQNMGRRYYERWDLNNARRCYYRAFYYNPFSLPKFVYYIIRTFLPKHLIKYYRVRDKYRNLRNIIRKIFDLQTFHKN